MYVSTYGRLAQVPTPYSSFAGTLGASPFPPEIQEFLNQVRKRRQDFKKLLLTVTFHPAPAVSMTFGKQKFNFGKQTKHLVDELMMSSIAPVDVLDPLRRIRDKFRTQDAGFKRQIEAELQIRNEMIETAGRLGVDREKLKLFLLKELIPQTVEAPAVDDWKLCRLGLSFAQEMLPPRLAQRITSSEASEAHLTNLGRFLRRYAEVLQGKDAAFKQLVEGKRKELQQAKRERERSQQMEKERERRQQRRRRP